MDSKKKALLAAALGVSWIGLAVWQWEAFQEPVRVPLTNVSGSAPTMSSAREHSGGLRVHVELLASARTQREAVFTPPRNVFAVPRQDGTLGFGNEMETDQAGALVPVSEETTAHQLSLAELAQYRYLGFFRMGENTNKKTMDMAVLSKDDEIMVVKVGEQVEDHVVLKALTSDYVTIRDTGTRVEHRVSLSEEPSAQP
jgi:hypothetical protein